MARRLSDTSFWKNVRWNRVRAWMVREAVVLSVLVLTAIGIWMFVELADVVREGSSKQLDTWLLQAMREPEDLSDPLGPHWFEEMARDFTALGGVGVLTALSVGLCGFLWLRREYDLLLVMATAAVGAVLLNSALKYAFDRPRPELVPHGSYVYTRSFPSGHSMMAAAVYLTIGVLVSRLQRRWTLRVYMLSVCAAITVLVGLSRVYLGVHWPTDVLAGWTAGGAWAAICYLLATWRHRVTAARRKHLEAQA